MDLEQHRENIEWKMSTAVRNTITGLFAVLIAFIAVEIPPNLGMTDFIANHTFFIRFIFILIHSQFLITILNIVLCSRSVSGKSIVGVIVSMAIASLACVIGSFLLSTITGVVNCTAWIVTISIIVNKRWNDIVD